MHALILELSQLVIGKCVLIAYVSHISILSLKIYFSRLRDSINNIYPFEHDLKEETKNLRIIAYSIDIDPFSDIDVFFRSWGMLFISPSNTPPPQCTPRVTTWHNPLSDFAF